MHCKSCELLIKQNIEDLDCGAHVDEISHKKWTLTVNVNDVDDLVKIEGAIVDAWYQTWNSIFDIQPTSSDTWIEKWLWLFVAAVLLFFFFQSDFSSLVPNYSELTVWVALLLWLVASVSTCLAVTGWIVVGYAELVSGHSPWKTQAQFHIGRIVAFILGWAILGAVWGSLNGSIWLSVVLNILVWLVLFYLWVQILWIVPNISKLWFHLPAWLGKKALSLKNPKYAVFVWALTFFLPCGFTQGMQLFALQSGGALQGALMMGFFAIGTFPVLFSLGLWTKYIKDKLTTLNPLIAALLVVFGIITMSNGYKLAQTLTIAEPWEVGIQGNVNIWETEVVEVWHNWRGFVPSVITLQKGKNYTLRVTPESDWLGCFYSLAYGGKEYPIKKWQSFDIFVDWSVSKSIPLVCASMWMSQGMIVIQ